jgi:hypothetical protein
MKSLITLLECVIAECGDICSVDTAMDIKTIHRRFEGQGIAFLTLHLPSLEDSLLAGLRDGYFTPNLDFKSRRSLPVFLGGFLELIFDRATGVILDTPSTDSIRAVRQICLLFKKIEMDCTDEVNERALARYVECDAEVEKWSEENENSPDVERFVRLTSLLYSSVFRQVDEEVRSYELFPNHGPGITADGLIANGKFTQPMWTDRLESVFPYWFYATTGSYRTDRYSRVDFREPGNEMAVKVITVPKTQKAPRIIAVEPTCMQFMQQGLFHSINAGIDRSYLHDFISTDDQEPNQLLSRQGSLDESLATLDLSEASDSVSCLLVAKMLYEFPNLRDGVFACRSYLADVPGHGVFHLAKFASMGSALCFPVETLVFFAIVLIGIERANHMQFKSLKEVSSLRGQVRVYGDDLVVPSYAAVSVAQTLKSFGFTVNASKSFWTGRFRESCGKEYYAGTDVTVVKCRAELPISQRDVPELVSLVSFRNQLFKAGMWKTVRELDMWIESIIPFPAVSETSSVLGRHTFLPLSGLRVGGPLQRPLVKGVVVQYRRRQSVIDDEAALMKCLGFASAGDPYGPLNQVTTERDHLLVGGRPVSSSIKHRTAYAD